MRLRGGIAVLAIAVGFGLVGCGGDDDDGFAAGVPGAGRYADEAPAVVSFGQPYTFSNGVTALAERRPDWTVPSRYEDEGIQLIRISVTMTNESPGPLDMGAVPVTGTIGGQPAEVDAFIEDDLVGRSGTILPGQAQRFDVLFHPQPGALTMEIGVPDRSESAFFTEVE